jgi:hypothetical protein
VDKNSKLHFKWALQSEVFIVFVFLFTKIILALFPVQYGIFRDEFYYLAMSSHLDFGYVDVPPLAPLLLALMRFVFVDSSFTLHLLPAICGAAFLYVSYKLVKTLGGNKYSRILVMSIVLFAPYFTAIDSVYTYDTFNKFFWLLCSYWMVRLLQTEDSRYWLLVGITVGLGLLFKITIISLIFSWFVGLLLTPKRRLLLKKEMFFGVFLTLLLVSPYLLWQIQHQFITFEYMGNYSNKITEFSFLTYIAEQNINLNPIVLPLWAGGLYYFLFGRQYRLYQSAGLTYISLLMFSFFMKGKADFIMPYYVVLLAGGCIWFEGILKKECYHYVRPVFLSLVLFSGICLLPMARPILPVDTFIRYYGEASTKDNGERKVLAHLPQFYADRFGWEEMADKVAHIYYALPASKQQKVCVLTRNYGEAGAVNYYEEKQHLPLRAVSGHNQYYIWGPGNYDGEIVIAIGFTEEDLQKLYRQVEEVETLNNSYMMPYELAHGIYLCRSPFVSFQNMSWFKWLD